MSSFTAQIASGLSSARAYAGEPVIYSRKEGGASVSLQAIRGVFESASDEIMSALEIETRMVDWLVGVDDLGGEPSPGDALAAGGRSFEVMPVRGEPAWRFSDPGETQYRIHTQEVVG